MTTTRRVPTGPAEKVRSLELFFDLVFVFAITQIAAVLTAAPTGTGLARVTVLLAVVWWMYGGYVWLTNALDLDRTRPRLLLLAGMAAYFVMSLAVPRYFEEGPFGLVLGVAYLVVVVVHTVGFLGTSGRGAIMRLGPLNLLGAVVLVVAGLLPPAARLWLALAVVVLHYATPHIVGIGGFVVGAGHFVERHGLALIILLGESIIAVGAAATGKGDVTTVVVGSLLALAVSAAMWWLYFDREDAAGEQALDAMPPRRRGLAALLSFGYAYLVMIVGVTVAAVGMKKAVTYLGSPLHDLEPWLLPIGLAGYLLGLAAFHRGLTPGWSWPRIAAAAAVWLCVPAGLLVGGWLELVVAALVLAGTALAEAGRGRSAPG